MALFIGPKLEYVWKHKTDESLKGSGIPNKENYAPSI